MTLTAAILILLGITALVIAVRGTQLNVARLLGVAQ